MAGLWIPDEVFNDQRLTALEKVIVSEIAALDDGKRGCFAPNSHLAKVCGCSERQVSGSIAKLAEIGYLKVEPFDGRHRILKSTLAKSANPLAKSARQHSKNCEADSQNLRVSFNRDNNIDNKISYNSNKQDVTKRDPNEGASYSIEKALAKASEAPKVRKVHRHSGETTFRDLLE